MAKYIAGLQVTTGAFAPAESPRGWRTLTRHTSISAARRAAANDVAEMHRVCGAGAWNHHTRIVLLAELTQTYRFECAGYYQPGGAGQFGSMRRADKCAVGAVMPVCFTPGDVLTPPNNPAGWATQWQCRECEVHEELCR